MASTSDDIAVASGVEQAAPADESGPQGAESDETSAPHRLTDVTVSPIKNTVSIPASTIENWEVELSTFSKPRPQVNEPGVVCVVTDETDSNWSKSRYTYSLSMSSSATDLYSAIAKETGELKVMLLYTTVLVRVVLPM